MAVVYHQSEYTTYRAARAQLHAINKAETDECQRGQEIQITRQVLLESGAGLIHESGSR